MDRPDPVREIAPGLTVILADNPSPMTYWGTNSFLLGSGPARVLIDPGPDLPAHRQAILDALPAGGCISHILVTHAHLDHSAGSAALKKATGADIFAFGAATSGRSLVMEELVAGGFVGGGEGIDMRFTPDHKLGHGDTLNTPAGPITALHTPGHMANHLSFACPIGDAAAVFCGDLIMGWSSSLISPPDGDARAFRESCQMLRAHAPDRLYPAHGAAIDDPLGRIDDLLKHRQKREAQILAALSDTPVTLEALTARVYTDTPAHLLPLAARNTFAHLIDLHELNRIKAAPNLREDAAFYLS